MKNNYKFLTLISLMLISLGTRSQTLTTILYSDEPAITNASACNVFATELIVDNAKHLTSLGRPSYLDNSIKLDVTPGSSNFKSTMYSIKYDFKAGFAYNVAVYYKGTVTGNDAYPNVALKISPDNGGTSTGITCTGPAATTGTIMASFAQLTAGATYGNVLAFTSTFATSGSYLLVGASPNSTSIGNASIYVRQIAITESLPGAFTLTPSTLIVPCNTSLTRTFAVNTVTSIPSGTLTYTWTIGSGWSYLGTPGPTIVTTPNNSITLVSSGSSTAPANVSVGVNFNGRNESNLTSAVSLAVLSNLAISGGNSMCTTGASNVYTIPNLPTGATIAWAATPTGIVTLSSTSGVSTTLTRSGAVGKVSLTATVTACGSVAGLTLPITVGVLDNTKLNVVGQGPGICPNVPIMFGARYNGICANFNAAGISDITWNVSPTPTQIVYNDGTAGCTESVNNAGITIKFPASPTQYNVKITATNTCGTTSFSTSYVVQIMPSCGSHLVTVAPNAASNTVTVATISKTSDATFDEVKIYNLQGTLKKHFQYKKVNSATLNVADLSNGIYFIEVTNGKIKDKLQLIIEK